MASAELVETDCGLAPKGDGWFVLNAREAQWWQRGGRGVLCDFEGADEGDTDFQQLGANLTLLAPGEPMAMYHWEADQEDFLVLSGEALLIIESEERTLRQWDFVHCPPRTNHTIVGAGSSPCLVLAVGARDRRKERGMGRLHGRHRRLAARGRGRAGDDKRGVRAIPAEQVDPL